ncbi:Slam-dependent surface lipoprotein [Marinobacterium lutimaris]|uniref:Transferrin-binding protein B C-lobe/N-lobe beta barrel domain-containing protein n=1 Tax=Marinobacterium lutimaris TaxID=568106 RepID=A0A1H6DJ90_9GAMM|nr:Slam-dependent surface lipoprotein [Marinobacterium lutimaris]SEG84765.1 hypothetical protein SAMN05444390_106181 [Marinobacterium lutimaris]
MHKLKLANAVALTLASLALAGAVQADVVGGSTNTSNVAISASTVPFGPHTAGMAGVAVNSTGINQFVDFGGLTSYGGTPTNGVYTLNFPYSGAPEDHDSLGVFNFAQVGSSDVWFGEWSAYGNSDATRTVYYSGSNADTAVPSAGTATYAVTGLNNFSGSNALSGQFTADFGASTLTGTLANANTQVSIGTATINNDASVSGNGAFGNFNGSLVTGGEVSAQFYNGQADLAGIVDFAGTDFDTAFGGSQQ